MLQQTRVTAVEPYYHRFLERFPTVETLAAAPEQDVLAAWAGLGYYSRARNLQRAARQMNGEFPSTWEGIRDLPGVGDYTASAVASIAFGLPHAAVDGNVLRVLARVSGDPSNISSPAGRRRIQELAGELLDRDVPGLFNQAVMELGATVCLPRNPRCLVCPVAEDCEARRTGSQHRLPVKSPKPESIRLERTLFLITREEQLLLWKRPDTERRLAGFWDIPEDTQIPAATPDRPLGDFRHAITRHLYLFHVVSASVRTKPAGFEWIAMDRLKSLPLTTVAKKALDAAGQRFK